MPDDAKPQAPGAEQAVAASPAPAPPAPAPAAGKYDALVDRCFVDMIHGSVASRDTETFNHLVTFRDELKRRLAAEAKQ